MNKNKKEGALVEKSFDIVLILKALFALGEILSGVAIFFINPAWIVGIIQWLTRSELQEDPRDFLMHMLINFGHHFTVETQYLVAIYLLVHGLVKIVTLTLLWQKILWAYPLSILVFLGFIIYQLREFMLHHSIFMIVVSLIDVLMIVLTILEYRNLKNKKTN